MSVELGVHVVDWQQCVKSLSEAAGRPEDFWEAMSPYRVELDYSTSMGMYRFSEYYDLCRPHVTSAWMEKFEIALDSLCWSCRQDAGSQRELEFPNDPEWYPVDLAWTPATVAKMYAHWRVAALSDFESLGIDDAGFDYKAFVSYYKDWHRIFAAAVQQKRGLIVTVWG